MGRFVTDPPRPDDFKPCDFCQRAIFRVPQMVVGDTARICSDCVEEIVVMLAEYEASKTPVRH